MSIRVILSALLCAVATCWATSSRDATTREPARQFSGEYIFAFERSEFTPFGSKEHWWLGGDIGPISRRVLQNRPIFVTVEGQLSSPGKHGHLGAYVRELRVTRVISVRHTL